MSVLKSSWAINIWSKEEKLTQLLKPNIQYYFFSVFSLGFHYHLLSFVCFLVSFSIICLASEVLLTSLLWIRCWQLRNFLILTYIKSLQCLIFTCCLSSCHQHHLYKTDPQIRPMTCPEIIMICNTITALSRSPDKN